MTAELLALGYTETEGVDLLTPDGREAYEIKFGGRGVRDLRDATLRLATFLARHSKVDRGYILVSLNRISALRVRSEWDFIKQALLPTVVARMHLVAIVDGIEVAETPHGPPTLVVERFRKLAKQTFNPPASHASPHLLEIWDIGSPPGVTWKHLEIEKILVHRWLLGEGPIALGILSKQVGCSYPTTTQAIRRLSANKLIERGPGRSVALAQYPRERWAEIGRAQRLAYPPAEFVSPVWEAGLSDELLRRLNKMAPKGAAMGGVIAARRWDSSFDLNGTPRIDVLLHTPVFQTSSGRGWERAAADFVRRLDPALQHRSPTMQGATVLALHHTYRRDSLFMNDSQSPLPWADPVEVLFHLNDLGLTAQAGQLVRHLRQARQ